MHQSCDVDRQARGKLDQALLARQVGDFLRNRTKGICALGEKHGRNGMYARPPCLEKR